MEQNLAVLIDFENIAAGTEKEGLGRFNVESLMQRFKDKGRVLIARSYADWGRFSRFKQSLLTENVTMMELTSHGMQDKNRADIALVVDALELAFTKDYIDTFVVVSGDSDFTPMVTKMRELNKRVIGCGTRRSTSRLLIQACDEFIFYDSIVKPPAKKRRPKPKKGGATGAEAAFSLLVDALEGLQRETPDPPLAGVVKQAMLRKTPDFSESDLGFGTFTKFLKAAQDAGYVRISRDNKSGGYRVDTVDASDENGEPPAAEEAGSEWVDEYIPAGVESWLDALAEAGIEPLSAPVRMDVLEAITEVVAARKKRRRKSTIHFVAEDVKKQLRRTHPTLPLTKIRGVLEAVRLAEQLIHRDGGPIRTPSATFKLNKDAVGLNKALLGTYLGALREANCELVDSKALAQLFLGDADRAREVEEALAWLATAGEGPTEALNEVNLDDLLVADAPAAPPAEAEAPAEDPPKKKKTRKRTTKKAAAKKAEPVEEPAAEEAPEAPAKDEAPAAEPVEAAAEAPEATAETAEAEVEAKPKPKTTRRRVRKKKEPAAEPAPSDLDALLEPAE